ncbi:MAG: M56 family metallopeptidase [Gemmataceae bacterium]
MSALVEVGLSNAVAALVLAVVALLAGLCRLRPAVVHALWLLVLLKLVTPPLVRIPVPLPTPAAAAEPSASPAEEKALPAPEEPAGQENNDVIALPPLREELIVRADGGDEDTDAVNVASLPATMPLPWAEWLAGAWAAGSVLWFGLAWLRVWRFGRLLRHGQGAPEAILRRVRRLSRRLGLAPPEVRVVPGRLAPMVWGLGRPLLLLPEGLVEQVGTEGLDTLLLHELSHLKRGDHHVRWLEFFALGLYWWLPVAWYARRELREAEEQCCDAWVVRTMPGARRLYATALVEALDFLSQPVTATPPLASALGEVADLKRRLTLIMRGTTPHLLGRPLALAVLGLALAVLPLVPGLGLGQEPRREQERKDVIRFVDNEDQKKLQEEIRRKKEEIEALAEAGEGGPRAGRVGEEEVAGAARQDPPGRRGAVGRRGEAEGQRHSHRDRRRGDEARGAEGAV